MFDRLLRSLLCPAGVGGAPASDPPTGGAADFSSAKRAANAAVPNAPNQSLHERVRRCIGVRLVVILTCTLALLLGASGWAALRLHRQNLLAMLERSALETGETILTSMRSSMMANDATHLRRIVSNVASQDRVVALRIVDATGKVRHAASEEEIGRVIPTTAPPCIQCHAGGESTVPNGGFTLTPSRLGPDVLGLGVPIFNSPGCATAPCHFHPQEQRVLGVLDLELSTAGIDQDVAAARVQMTAQSVATIVVACALVGLISWRVVHVPIRRLTEAARRVASGDLEYRIPIRNEPGELAELARSFNEMTRELEVAYCELEDFNATLETRIERKTSELESTRDQMIFSARMASLGKLAAIVAHELNNPLGGLLVYARLVSRRLPRLLESSEPPSPALVSEIKESLATMEREIARCGDIVRNLLAFSRRETASKAPQDLGIVLDRALRLVRHQAEMQDVKVVREFDADLPETWCDAAQMEQAALAIIINALEAMPSGGRLTLRCSKSKAERITIEIEDTGPGIPPEIRQSIFEPFFTTKIAGKGTGLGLAVAYGIIGRHGGELEALDGTNGGSLFRITLPINEGGGASSSHRDGCDAFESDGGVALAAESTQNTDPGYSS